MKDAIVREIKSAKSLMVAVALGLVASSAAATIIIQDDFNGADGSSPSATDWGYTSAVTLDGSSNVEFDSTGGFQQLVGTFSGPSSQAFAPSATQMGRVTYENIGGNVLFNMTLGLSGYGDRIWLRTDLADSFWNVDINSGGAFTYRPTDVAQGAGGTWRIDWYTNRILAYHNSILKFDSLTDLPTAGDPTWSIPTGVMRPDIGGAGGQIMLLDSITWESQIVTPEPSTAALLGLGGLLMFWRGRRGARG